MEVVFPFDRSELKIDLPSQTEVFVPSYPEQARAAADVVRTAVWGPIGSGSLNELLRRRQPGRVVVVVSDITRPIPYACFLGELLGDIERAGVPKEEILILIATGMHRPSTARERSEMFGQEVVSRYQIEDHRAEDESGLKAVPGLSASGRAVRLNKHYVEAGFRLITGLVEPHFMAGFSGGRKAICPGLASLDTVGNFHGEKFLSRSTATNGCLAQNPLHQESLSVARLCPPDFTLNVVLDQRRRIAGAFAGGLEPAHSAACEFVKQCAFRRIQKPADLVITSSGGYPLDATFYQCVKGFVSCLPAVREGGAIISIGGCAEGVGSPEYGTLMGHYAGRWQDFLRDIRQPGGFTKDQWQFQMHTRALARVSQENLHFVTEHLPQLTLNLLSITGHQAAPGHAKSVLQKVVDRVLRTGMTVAAFPEGPYCVAEYVQCGNLLGGNQFT